MSDDMNVFIYSEDLNNAEAPNPLPAGNYPAEVLQASIEDSKSKPGRKNLKLTLFIAPESYPADYLDGNPDGMKLDSYTSLRDDPRGRFQMKKFNETLGVKNSTKVDPNDYMGCTCTVEITHRDYQGMAQESIGKILARQ